MVSWSGQLRRLLDGVEPLGSFATVGVIEELAFPLPVVTVAGVGRLSFPLMPVAVEPLKAVSEKAPYGKGTETVQDDAVRKAWQVDASNVALGGGEAWDACLRVIVEKVCYQLGFSAQRIKDLGIHANLYKFLLYEQGGHFTPHRDTEKEDGMFGTLILQLPSLFTGGELSVWHDGACQKFELANQCEDQFKQIGFFADCEHQLHPITSGFRVCLVFNLVAAHVKKVMDGEVRGVALPSHSNNIETESKLRLLAADWVASGKQKSRLGYRLGHQYTPKTFSFASLKGRDSIVVQSLLDAKTSDGTPLFRVHLLMMERYVLTYPDHYGNNVETDKVQARLVLDRNNVKLDGTRWTMTIKKDGWLRGDAGDDEAEDEQDKPADKQLRYLYTNERDLFVQDVYEDVDEDDGIEDDDGSKDDDGGKDVDDSDAVAESAKQDDCEEDNEEEEEEEEEDGDDDDDDDDDSRIDDYGNNFNKMFQELHQQKVEPHMGNSAGSVEHWYFVTAVVISPITKSKPAKADGASTDPVQN